MEHGSGSGGSSSSRRRDRCRRARSQNVPDSSQHSSIPSQGSFTPFLKRPQYYVDEEGYYHEVNCYNEDEESAESDDCDDAKNKSAATLDSDLAKLDLDSASDETHSMPTITLPLYQYDPVERKLLTDKFYADMKSIPEEDAEGVFAITFDGYYRKNSQYGGYGAMLWRGGEEDGGPLYALTGCSQFSVSAFVHTLEGFYYGLGFADGPNSGVQSVFMVCNSERVCETLRELFINLASGKCRYHSHSGNAFLLCDPCLKDKLTLHELKAYHTVFALVRGILERGRRYNRPTPWIAYYKKAFNEPANYLAKYLISRHRRLPGAKKVFKLHSFPDELKVLVNRFEGHTPFFIR